MVNHNPETALAYFSQHLEEVGVIEFSFLNRVESEVEQGNTKIVEMLTDAYSNCEWR